MRSADTDPAVERVQVELMRQATPARRAALARSLSRTTLELARRAIRQADPNVDEREVAVRFAAICHGPSLANGLRRYLQAGQEPATMRPVNPPDVLAALTPVVEALEGLGVRYHIGGSLASSA